MMNAALTPAYGPAEVLRIRRLPVPTPGPGEVLVRVDASAVTAGDLRMRSADFGPLLGVVGRLLLGVGGPRRPVQGTMFAGEVVDVGPGVERFGPGDAVFGSSARGGAWAGFLVVPEEGALATRPPDVTPDEAAAVPYGAGTAWSFLHDLGAVQPGERVLVLGGAGGVGRFAIQIARHLGAHVTAVGRAGSADLMRALGAHVTVDYRSTDFTAVGATWDVVFDTAGASSFAHSRPVLTPNGRYLTLHAGLRVALDMLWTRWRRGPRALFGVASGSSAQTAVIADLLASGAIRPVVAEAYPIHRIADAHRRAESGVHGAVVVHPLAV
ncbi:MAG: NAD(P)-dependent alcohol dehydrogenase [Alphaproteobacteria bacterium]|nr:NAD(P)-dependent alcohol dehydrogenase [Alphaproteobacteria bacterium]